MTLVSFAQLRRFAADIFECDKDLLVAGRAEHDSAAGA